jgi:hypothetical protein
MQYCLLLCVGVDIDLSRYGMNMGLELPRMVC